MHGGRRRSQASGSVPADNPQLVATEFLRGSRSESGQAHPKIMSWFRAQTKAQSRRKDDNLDTLMLSLNEQAKLPALFGQ